MKRIEIVGTSGVGKSTLYKSIISNRESDELLMSSKEAKYYISKEILRRDKSYLRYFFLLGIKLPIIDTKIVNKIPRVEYKNLLWYSNNELCDFIHTLLTINSFNPNESLRILYRYSWLLSKLGEAAVFDRYLPNHYVLIDEPIFHKLTNTIILYDGKENIESIAGSIFSKSPLPYAIIHLDTDPSLIYEQFCKRENKKDEWTFGFRGYDEDELYDRIIKSLCIVRTGVRIMKERGVKVVEINASDSDELKIGYINVFLDQIINIP